MNSSFRKYGGLNYSSSNNIVRNHFCNNYNLTISEKIGLLNSKILNESHIDMSGNSILGVKDIIFYDGTVFNGTNGINDTNILDATNIWTNTNTFSQIPTITATQYGSDTKQIATVGYVNTLLSNSLTTASLSSYATTASLSGYALSSEIPSLTNYATINYVQSDYASLDGSNTFTSANENTFNGTNTFSQYPTISPTTLALPTNDNSLKLATTNFVTSYVTSYVTNSLSDYANITLGNSFSGTQTFDIISATSISASTFSTTSDYRIKENVNELNETYSVDNLRPVEYENKITNKQSLGFIAHEVQEQYPFLVTGEKDGKENQSINYQEIIPILVKEIQDLKKRVTLLEN